jgi:hypothetical protein
MSELSNPGQRLTAALSWSALTDAPLRGLQLAREARLVLAWDDGPFAAIYDLDGRRQHHARSPAPILAARISDDGRRVVLLVAGPRMLSLDASLGLIDDRPAPAGALGFDLDPHGRFVAVSTRSGEVILLTAEGRQVGRVAARQPFPHLRFVPAQPVLLGAAGYGMIQAFQLAPGSSPTRLEAEPIWDERLLSNLGRLEVTGDGQVILASCYNVGIQRYDVKGHNEGSYHLGGTAIHAVPDFPGRLIAAATQEGELAILNRAGNIRWRTGLAKAPVALEFDPLGRFLIYGLETGEIACLDFEGAIADRVRSGRAGPTSPGGALRRPTWSLTLARDEEEGQASVVGVVDEPTRIGVGLRDNRLRVFDAEGRSVGQSPELRGIGRFIRTAPGWIALATDRDLVLYDTRRDAWHRPDLDLVQITHLVPRPDRYGLAIVQERDRVGRASLAGRWVWRRDVRTGVEELAIGPLGLTAYTTDDGDLLVIDAAGEPTGRFQANPPEPLLIVDAPESSQSGGGPTWVSLARRAQILRGHGPDATVLWETPTPWEGWHLERVGPHLIVSAPDGRALAYDARGFLQLQVAADGGTSIVFEAADGRLRRLTARGTQLACVGFDGRVDWRSAGTAPFRPLAAARAGVAAMQATDLTWFAADPA